MKHMCCRKLISVTISTLKATHLTPYEYAMLRFITPQCIVYIADKADL